MKNSLQHTAGHKEANTEPKKLELFGPRHGKKAPAHYLALTLPMTCCEFLGLQH